MILPGQQVTCLASSVARAYAAPPKDEFSIDPVVGSMDCPLMFLMTGDVPRGIGGARVRGTSIEGERARYEIRIHRSSFIYFNYQYIYRESERDIERACARARETERETDRQRGELTPGLTCLALTGDVLRGIGSGAPRGRARRQGPSRTCNGSKEEKGC